MSLSSDITAGRTRWDLTLLGFRRSVTTATLPFSDRKCRRSLAHCKAPRLAAECSSRQGRFSSGAAKFAEQVPITDSLCSSTERNLVRLMVRYDVGVAVREIYRIKSVDDDFFEDGEL